MSVARAIAPKKAGSTTKGGRSAPDETAAMAMKFCRYHDIEHPATLEVFASNKAAKDGLYYICKTAEREIRDRKKAQAAARAKAGTADPKAKGKAKN